VCSQKSDYLISSIVLTLSWLMMKRLMKGWGEFPLEYCVNPLT